MTLWSFRKSKEAVSWAERALIVQWNTQAMNDYPDSISKVLWLSCGLFKLKHNREDVFHYMIFENINRLIFGWHVQLLLKSLSEPHYEMQQQ